MKMKKAIIALAIAAGTMSTSAMAWVEGGTGGSVDLGGTITPDTVVTSPWEVKVGSGSTGLDYRISTGVNNFTGPVPNDIMILGVRTTNGEFSGRAGISPQIDYAGKVNVNSFVRGVANVTLPVHDAANNQEIGTLTTQLTAGAMGSTVLADGAEAYYMLKAGAAGDGFFGGLGSTDNAVHGNPDQLAQRVDAEIVANWQVKGTAAGVLTTNFAETSAKFNGFYVSAIEANKQLTINLNAPLTQEVTWKASLPVTVSYQ